MIKLIFFISIGLLTLSGCASFDAQKPYKITPPEYLLQPCYPDKPEAATFSDIIVIQNAAIRQCNDQLETLRNWKEVEEEQE